MFCNLNYLSSYFSFRVFKPLYRLCYHLDGEAKGKLGDLDIVERKLLHWMLKKWGQNL